MSKYTKICRVCSTKAVNNSCPKCGHGCNIISIDKSIKKHNKGKEDV